MQITKEELINYIEKLYVEDKEVVEKFLSEFVSQKQKMRMEM